MAFMQQTIEEDDSVAYMRTAACVLWNSNTAKSRALSRRVDHCNAIFASLVTSLCRIVIITPLEMSQLLRSSLPPHIKRALAAARRLTTALRFEAKNVNSAMRCTSRCRAAVYLICLVKIVFSLFITFKNKSCTHKVVVTDAPAFGTTLTCSACGSIAVEHLLGADYREVFV